ncbi:MAG: hypothetical protein PHE02_12285 [Lachnospiraceae bacterium]|nr:hypothetical protein [Lachnospiraceae bacterium]
MDNFMDKLAQKMSASELIKANSAAEAMELRRLQEQLAEYESILQEMRKLNLKNSELTDQTRELVGIGLSDIRKALNEVNAEKAQNEEDKEQERISIEEKLSKVAENLYNIQQMLADQGKEDKSTEELMDKIEDFVHKENVKVYRNVQAVVVDNLKTQTEELQAGNTKVEKRLSGIKPLMIATMVIVLADVVINVIQMLGIL